MSVRIPRPDTFVLAIVSAAVLASLLPATGVLVPVLAWTTKLLVAILFFLYGARLSPEQSLQGLRNWRLHLVIFCFTFVLFPLLGVALRLLRPHLLSPELYAGVLWLTLVPSTVQSSVNFTSIAKGNVAGAIVSASFSNLIGVFITPLLAVVLMTTSGGVHIELGQVIDIVCQLLVPFLVGQLSRRWTAAFVGRHPRLKLVDQASIVLIVYAAFSQGMREHMWSRVDARGICVLVVVCAVVVAAMLGLTWRVARGLGFNRADSIAIQFCGTKKSLATGVPMATVLFAGLPGVGLMVLPLMIFHQLQLMACAILAARHAREAVDA